MTKTIPLTKDQYAIVDDADADLACYHWCLNDATPGNLYAKRGCRDRQRALHRVIMARKLGRSLAKGERVDFVNNNGLDCRRDNLRLAPPGGTQQNTGRPRTNTSGYKGVTWNKSKRKYIAQISVNNKRIHLGHFDDPAEAFEHYKMAVREYHGEFGNTGE